MALVHYIRWKKNKRISPNSLVLDPLNYRLDHNGKPLSQAEIREALVEKEGVKEFAAALSHKGYMPVEDVIVVHENGKHIVVEGNRRVCAYQLIARPQIAPSRHRKSFERIHDRAANDMPARIYCVVAPNRAEANVYIYSKHADDSFSRKWARIRQASFIADKLAGGSSIEELIEETGISRQRILESLAALDLFRLAGAMDLPDRQKQTLTDPATFPFTALAERIFGAEEIRDHLGVKLTSQGLAGVAGDKIEFLKIARKIFLDVSDGEQPATRLYGTKEKAITRIKEMGYKATGVSKWRVFSPDSSPQVEEPPALPAAKPKRPSPIRLRLLPGELVCEIGGKKLASIVDEAKRLNHFEFPHASAILLRTILELSLHAAISARSLDSKIAAKHSRHRNAIELGMLLEEVKLSTLLDLGLEAAETRGLKHLVENGPLSHDVLNLYVHNPHWPATGESVTAFRENIFPILRKALAKPSAS